MPHVRDLRPEPESESDMGAAAAAVVVAEKRMVEVFEIAGATSPDTARTPDELGVDPSSLGWRRLRNRAVVRETSPDSGRYYLDREVWRAVRRTRQRLVIVLAVVVLAIWLYVATGAVLRGSARMHDTSAPAARG